MQSLFNLEGKVALVTGSSRGLGKSMAEALAEAGAFVILNGRDRTRLEMVNREFHERNLTAMSISFDVTKEEEVDLGFQKIDETWGPVDILVNNAGIQIRHPAENFPHQDWNRLIETNLTASFITAQYAVRGMLRRRSGKIINVCSVLSEVARPGVSAYTVSKGGLKMLTKAMAAEWGAYNIQCNGIGPGYFNTEMNQPLMDDIEFNAWVKKRTPSARWGDPKDLKGPIVFLASKASDYVNGHILYVDGGLLATI